MALELSLCGSDSDIVRPLLDGTIEPAGIDLTAFSEYPPKRHRRFVRHGEFDICEVSLASYLASRSEPAEHPFTAIPVYPSKKFRHSFLYRHADAEIDDPGDLAGKKVGVQSWQTTANVWVRGIAADQYGLDLGAVEWYSRRADDVQGTLPDRFDIQRLGDAVEETGEMQERLFSGELDAAMDPAGSFFNAVVESERAELVFDEPIAAEKQYFRETGIHPIMHVVAIRDEILDAHPWVAGNVYDAFCDARDRALERNKSPSTHMTLTWAHLHRHEQRRVLGENIWAYGLTEQTRRELETFVRYAHDQGLIPREYDIEELFVESTLDL